MAERTSHVHSVRVPDEDWTAIQEQAQAAGLTVNGYIVEAAARPSWSRALRVVEAGIASEADIVDRLSLSGAPAAAAVTKRRLVAVADRLHQLAARWPR